MTQRESIALFRSKASGSGFISDDDKYPVRRILLELKTAIAVIKKRRLTNKQPLPTHDFITLPCVELTQLDRVECPTIPPSGMFWLKSVEPMPRFILLEDVISLVGNVTIPVLPWNKLRARGSSRNKSIRDSAVATFRNEGDKIHLYILNSNLEAVAVPMVPEDYAEAATYPQCGVVNKALSCNPLDIEIGADYATVLEASDMIISRELNIVPKVKSDELNNDTNVS